MNALARPNAAPVALITGGARRIGAAIARLLHGAGIDIALHYRASAAAADVLADEFNRLRPGSATALAAVLGDRASAEALVSATEAHFGRLDILVNNAGTTRDTLLPMMKEEDWDTVIETNLRGAYLVTKAALRPMLRQKGGRIIKDADARAIGTPDDIIAYLAATKDALDA